MKPDPSVKPELPVHELAVLILLLRGRAVILCTPTYVQARAAMQSIADMVGKTQSPFRWIESHGRLEVPESGGKLTVFSEDRIDHETIHGWKVDAVWLPHRASTPILDILQRALKPTGKLLIPQGAITEHTESSALL